MGKRGTTRRILPTILRRKRGTTRRVLPTILWENVAQRGAYYPPTFGRMCTTRRVLPTVFGRMYTMRRVLRAIFGERVRVNVSMCSLGHGGRRRDTRHRSPSCPAIILSRHIPAFSSWVDLAGWFLGASQRCGDVHHGVQGHQAQNGRNPWVRGSGIPPGVNSLTGDGRFPLGLLRSPRREYTTIR